tara:strand:+ start:661 stop:1254 length:594 start_codon:yes stop_codon:yes gene_type:complete
MTPIQEDEVLKDEIQEDEIDVEVGNVKKRFTLASVCKTQQLVEKSAETLKEKRAINNMEKLAQKIKNRQNAHKDCRELNLFFDKLLSIGTLVSSGVTTYLINVHTDEDESGSYLVERIMGFTTTFISAASTLFDNKSQGCEHHRLSRNYTGLLEEIQRTIDNEECTKEGYTEYNKQYQAIHSNSISLFPHIRKKYKI